MRGPRPIAPAGRRPGYVLVVVLIVIVVLSLAAYTYTEAMTAQQAVAYRSTEAVQAKALAASGVHYAAAALADPNTLNGPLAGNPYDAAGFFAGVQVGDAGGQFSIVTAGDTYAVGGGEGRYVQRYGVTDESGKLNVNALIAQDKAGTVLHDALMKLPNMTEEVADAIVDWVDPDDSPRAAGAETDTYQGRATPYKARNGPLASLDELLLVQGVTPQLLYGNDRNRNGRRDAGEDDGTDFSRGWSEFLTVYGRELDADVAGNPRVNLNDDDVETTHANLISAVGQPMADYLMYVRLGGTTATVPGTSTTTTTTSSSSGSRTTTTTTTTSGGNANVSYVDPAALTPVVQGMIAGGGKKQVSSIFSLTNTYATLPKATGAPANAPTQAVLCPLNDPAQLADLLPKLLDGTTTRTGFEMIPRVNVNTAPPEVLAALPGLEQTDVDAIVAARSALAPTDLATLTGAWLVTSANLTTTKFRAVEKYVTGRTGAYRVQSVGHFARGGPTARVEAVIEVAQGRPRIVYYRDLNDLGRGFDLTR